MTTQHRTSHPPGAKPTLSDNNKKLLRYFWTSEPGEEADFMLRAVQVGLHPSIPL